jgi:hypothetical protein
MTVAVDKVTGRVLGQVVERVSADVPHPPISGERVSLLTREGYVTVPRSTVTLEEVR